MACRTHSPSVFVLSSLQVGSFRFSCPTLHRLSGTLDVSYQHSSAAMKVNKSFAGARVLGLGVVLNGPPTFNPGLGRRPSGSTQSDRS
jgi:hypothetical protein